MSLIADWTRLNECSTGDLELVHMTFTYMFLRKWQSVYRTKPFPVCGIVEYSWDSKQLVCIYVFQKQFPCDFEWVAVSSMSWSKLEGHKVAQNLFLQLKHWIVRVIWKYCRSLNGTPTHQRWSSWTSNHAQLGCTICVPQKRFWILKVGVN